MLSTPANARWRYAPLLRRSNAIAAQDPLRWKRPEFRRSQLEIARNMLGLPCMADWYQVTRRSVANLGLSGLLRYHRNSLPLALIELFPEHNWEPWRFRRTPMLLWSQPQLRRQYFDFIAQRLHIKHPLEWCAVTLDTMASLGARGLLASRYDHSLIKALQDVYPEHAELWRSWNLRHLPSNYFTIPANRNYYLQWIGRQLNIKSLDDWYTVEAESVRRLPGGSLLLEHKSLPELLQEVIPSHKWQPWLFISPTQCTWADPGVRQSFALHLQSLLGIKDSSEWYRVRRSSIRSVPGGSGWLNFFGGSLCDALMDAFPAFPWEKPRFEFQSDAE